MLRHLAACLILVPATLACSGPRHIGPGAPDWVRKPEQAGQICVSAAGRGDKGRFAVAQARHAARMKLLDLLQEAANDVIEQTESAVRSHYASEAGGDAWQEEIEMGVKTDFKGLNYPQSWPDEENSNIWSLACISQQDARAELLGMYRTRMAAVEAFNVDAFETVSTVLEQALAKRL